MSKARIVNLLNENGYNAEILSDIPMVRLEVIDYEDSREKYKKLKLFLQEHDYNCSFGIKVKH